MCQCNGDHIQLDEKFTLFNWKFIKKNSSIFKRNYLSRTLQTLSLSIVKVNRHYLIIFGLKTSLL